MLVGVYTIPATRLFYAIKKTTHSRVHSRSFVYTHLTVVSLRTFLEWYYSRTFSLSLCLLVLFIVLTSTHHFLHLNVTCTPKTLNVDKRCHKFTLSLPYWEILSDSSIADVFNTVSVRDQYGINNIWHYPAYLLANFCFVFFFPLHSQEEHFPAASNLLQDEGWDLWQSSLRRHVLQHSRSGETPQRCLHWENVYGWWELS